MSVIVRDMEMPTDCRECRLMEYRETWCKHAGGFLAGNFRPIPIEGRPDWCPLVELPEKHGDLIDRDALMDIFADRLAKVSVRYGIDSAVAGAVSGAMKLLDLQPTVVEAEGK